MAGIREKQLFPAHDTAATLLRTASLIAEYPSITFPKQGAEKWRPIEKHRYPARCRCFKKGCSDNPAGKLYSVFSFPGINGIILCIICKVRIIKWVVGIFFIPLRKPFFLLFPGAFYLLGRILVTARLGFIVI